MLLAGLWTRRGMNAAILLVSVVAVTAAVLGPMYGRASVEHLLDTRIDERAPYTTGLTVSIPAVDDSETLPTDPDEYQPPRVSGLVDTAGARFDDPQVRRFWPTPTSWALDPSGSFLRGSTTFSAPLYWRQGMCRLAEVTGRCPQRAGEVLMQETMARTLHLSAGDVFRVTYADTYLSTSTAATTVSVGQERQRVRTVTYRITGTYVVPDPSSPAWFDLSRFTGLTTLVPPPARGTGGDNVAPALLTVPDSFTSQGFRAGVDRPLSTRAADLATLDAVQAAATRFKNAQIDLASPGQTEVLPDLDVASPFDQVRSERTLLTRVLVAALAPLVVLALLLLFALVSSAAQVRRPQVALAKLRGHTRGQVLWFAVSEPFAVVAVAAPVGVALAWVAARVVARGWLHPGIPVGLDAVAVVGLVVVVAASLLASTLAALTVIREPLSVALAAGVRPRAGTRLGLVLRSAVVAVALAAVANLVSSGDQSNQLLALVTPMLVALAVAVGGAALLRLVARVWVRRTEGAGGTAGFLASRRLARRQDLANLMVPLLLAVAIVTFAATTTATSDDWRLSRAEAQVGAGSTYLTSASPGRLLQVTHDVDPRGRYLMATVVDTGGDDMGRTVYVDSPRLPRVATWDDAWSPTSLAALADRLRPHRPGLTFSGERLDVGIAGVRLTSATRTRPALRMAYLDDRGERRDVLVGNLRNGLDRVYPVPVAGCAGGCTVQQLYLGGTSSSVSDAQGRLTVTGVSVDGRRLDWGLERDGAWRAARPFPVSLVDPPVLLQPGADGLTWRVYLGRLPVGGPGPADAQVAGFARITPTTTPDVQPVVVADGTRTTSAAESGSGLAIEYPASTVVGNGVNGQDVPMRVVGRSRALPVVGTEGAMGDLTTSLVEFAPPAGAVVTTELFVAPGTPASVLDRVRAQGVGLSDVRREATVLRALRTDAFSLGLRLFLIVGLATVLLAVFGVLAAAVLQSRWRAYEVAALRVVGVGQRALVRGSVLEYVVLLGVAVLLGVVSAYLSLRLVLPSLSLGTSAPFDPAPVHDAHWPLVGGVAGALFVLAVLIAVVVSRRITRLGRPSTLRWAEQG